MSTVSSMPPTLKLGRLARSYDSRIPKLDNLLAGVAAPPPPPSVDYTRSLPSNLGIMLNDRLNDCTVAAFYHAMQVWNGNTGRPVDTEPDSDVRLLYEKACGYKPSVGGDGPGGNEQRVLTYILKDGAPFGALGKQTAKIAAFVEVDVQNIENVKRTIADCGVAYIGFNVPKYIMPDGAPPLKVWDVNANADNTIIGGHAVVLAGYDAKVAKLISWGQYYTMTWAFFTKFVDETYALVAPEWTDVTKKTPGGLSLERLQQAMRDLKAS